MIEKGKSQKHICMLVHNAVSDDIRVMKEAKSLVASGVKVTVIGLLPIKSSLPLDEEIDGVHIIRIKRYMDKKYEEFQNNQPLFIKLQFIVQRYYRIIYNIRKRATRFTRILYNIRKRAGKILSEIQKIVTRFTRILYNLRKRAGRILYNIRKFPSRFTKITIAEIKKTIRWGYKEFLHLRNIHRSHSIPYLRTIYRLIFQSDIDMKDDAEIIRTLKAVDADVYHAHDYPALLQIVRAFPENNKTKIYDSHELFFDRQPSDSPKREIGRKYRLEKIQEKRYARKADHIITVSESIAEVMQEKWQVPKPTVILNAVDTRDPGIKEIDYFVQGRIIVHSGNITYGRNLSQLVKGLAHTPEDINLILMGTARPYIITPLLEIAENLKIKHRIHLVSPVEHNNIYKTLNQADAGVVLFARDALNYRYGMPNKFFEYISAGLPILAGQADEMAGIILSQNIGVLCNEGDPISIGNGIIEILEEKSNKFFRDNLKRVKESINWENEEEKLIKFYKGVFK